MQAHGLSNAMDTGHRGIFLDTIEAIICHNWCWVVLSLFAICAVASGWSLFQASANSPESSQLPRHFTPDHSSIRGYGSLSITARDYVYETRPNAVLLGQVQAGKRQIDALETKVGALLALLETAEVKVAQLPALREEVQQKGSAISSLNTKVAPHLCDGTSNGSIYSVRGIAR